MPDFVPEPLQKEVTIGGRKIALWVPVVGAGVAVLLVVAVKLRKATGGGAGGGATTEPPTTTPPEAGPPPSDVFQSALTALQSNLSQVQSTLAEQIAAGQKVAAEQAGLISGVSGRVAGLTAEQAATSGRVTGLTGQVVELTGAQKTLTGQVTGLSGQVSSLGKLLATAQGQIAAQSEAFQAGIAGVQSKAERFQADTNARFATIEATLADLQTKANAQTSGMTASDKFKIGSGLGFIINYGLNPIAGKVGLPMWESQADAQTGSMRVKPPGGDWMTVW